MNKYIYDGNNELWYELQGDYYFHALPYHPKKKKPLGYGDSGICDISRNISGYSMSIC